MSDKRNVSVGRDAYGNVIIQGDRAQVTIVHERLVAAVPEPPQARDKLGPNPYKSLQYFDENDADRFFGRSELTKELYRRFAAVQSPGRLRLLPVLGPSGCGKSSVVRAGLIPELARQALPALATPRVAILTPGAHPLEALGTVLARIATNDPAPVAKARELTEELARRSTDSGHDGLRRIADALPDSDRQRLVLLIDQFEEVYALTRDNAAAEAQRDALIANLLDAAADPGGRVSVILGVRSDFLGATLAHPELNRVVSSEAFIVPAMSADELRETIAKPAELAGYPLDPATVELLIEQTSGREGALPLLQFTLTRIWEGLEHDVAPEATLKSLGGVGGALASFAKELYGSLVPAEQVIARRAFLKMVQLGEGTHDTRRRAELGEITAAGETAEQVLNVLRRFSAHDRRMITLLGEGTAVAAELTHEMLISRWDDLHEWIAQARDDERYHRQLAEDATEWEHGGRPKGSLYRPPKLIELRTFGSAHHADLTSPQLAFFEASEKAWNLSWWSRTLAIAVVVLLALFTSVAGWYVAEQQEKLRQEAQQAARKGALVLSSLAEKEAEADRGRRAVLLAMEALPRPFDPRSELFVPQALAALRRGLHEPVERFRLLHGDDVNLAAFSTDGTRIVTAASDSTARVWDAATGKLLLALGGYVASFSADGTRIVTASYGSTAWVWDVASGQLLLTLEGHRGPVYAAAFSVDGTRILTRSMRGVTSADNTARVWDAASGKLLLTLDGHGGSYLSSAAFSADGTRIVTASSGAPFPANNTTRVWDAASGKPLLTLGGHGDAVASAAFSTDGTRIVTAASDRTARVWEVATGKPLLTLDGHLGSVISAAFSTDGTRIVTASQDRTARVWDAATGKPLLTLEGHSDLVNSAAFSTDGTRIVTAADDNTARVWEVAGSRLPLTLDGHLGSVNSAAFSTDGTRIVTAASDSTARVWDAATGKPLLTLDGHLGSVNSAAFSTDGTRIVTAASDRTARVWAAATGKPLLTLEGHGDAVNSAAFSTDGTRIVTAADDSMARVWEVATGKPLLKMPASSLPRTRERRVNSAVFSADGTRIVTAASDRTARVWAAATGKPLLTLEGHGDAVNSVAFSADGTRIVTASGGDSYADKSARVWDAATGKPLLTLEGHGVVLFSAAFSTDGTRIVTASQDRTARVWDAATGKPLLTLEGHGDAVNSAAFSTDGTRIVTAASDRTARVWAVPALPADASDLVRYARDLSLCPLLAEERQQFNLDDPDAPNASAPPMTAAEKHACGIWE